MGLSDNAKSGGIQKAFVRAISAFCDDHKCGDKLQEVFVKTVVGATMQISDSSGHGGMIMLCPDEYLDPASYEREEVPLFDEPNGIWANVDSGCIYSLDEQDLMDMAVQDGATFVGVPSGKVSCRMMAIPEILEMNQATKTFRAVGQMKAAKCVTMEGRNEVSLIRSDHGMRRRTAIKFSVAMPKAMVIVASSDGGFQVLFNGKEIVRG